MTTRLLLLADTHWPVRARDLDGEVWEAIAAADVVLHAGDWVDVRLLERMLGTARHLVACWGNNDPDDLHARLPEVADVTIEGTRIRVVHETGTAKGREARMDAAHPGVDVLVFGHSHIPWDSTAPAGMRLLNPGSPTDRRRMPHRTYMTALVHGPRALDVALHRIGA